MSVRSDQDMRKRFKKLTIRVLNFEVVSGTDIQKNVLGLKSSARIYHLQRVQYGDGKPIVYESIYLPCKYFTKIPKEECTHSINDIVNTHAQFNSSLRRNRIVIEAKAATKSTSSYLAIPINSPLLKLKMTVMVNETPYYYGSAYYPGNEYNFVAEE
jgi:GntR family transcriptional regulator